MESKRTTQMNLFAKRDKTHSCREETYGYQRGWGAGKLGVWD